MIPPSLSLSQCLLALEEEVLSIFPKDRLITPDDVRGEHATLAKSIATRQAWPTLEEAAGEKRQR